MSIIESIESLVSDCRNSGAKPGWKWPWVRETTAKNYVGKHTGTALPSGKGRRRRPNPPLAVSYMFLKHGSPQHESKLECFDSEFSWYWKLPEVYTNTINKWCDVHRRPLTLSVVIKILVLKSSLGQALWKSVDMVVRWHCSKWADSKCLALQKAWVISGLRRESVGRWERCVWCLAWSFFK